MTSYDTRVIRLLDRGFYPVELPPPFKTRNFSAVRNSIPIPSNYHGSTTFFDGATFRGTLRTFGVINPLSYLLLSKYISEKWLDISKVYKLSSCSGARPKFPTLNAAGRAIEAASLAKKRGSQRHLAGVYPVVLSLDINRFYGSIYTHSIPWAVLGKQNAKSMYRSHTLSGHWSDRLDTLVRNCNQRQTVGIPIGPDTSRIVSELILSRIDREITLAGTGIATQQIYHNIDDYQIGTYRVNEAENAQSCFVRTISRYELRLNDFKSSINQGMDFTPSNFQRNFDILRDQKDSNFVEHLFEIMYSDISRHPNTNVLGYALKRFAKQLARNSNKILVREYLQRLMFTAPHQARWIMPILLGIYRKTGQGVEFRRLLNWGIEICARRNDAGSLLWFLYAAIFLNIKLTKEVCGQCIGMSNELVDLMLFHGRHENLFSFDVRELRSRYADSDLSSPAWLPIYEVGRRSWDSAPAFNKLGGNDDKDDLYKFLSEQDVEFYITDRDMFQVESFEGWNLEQKDFIESEEDWRDTDWHHYGSDWENYD